LLTVAGGLTAAIFAMRICRKTSWIAVKPTSWLLQDARATGVIRAGVARDELLRRLGRRHLSAEHEGTIFDHLLDLQASPRLSWTDEYCIQRLPHDYATGRLSPTQTERFLRNLVVFRLDVRSVVSPDGPLPIRLYAEQRFRLGSSVDTEVVSLACDGHEMEVDLEQLHLRWPWHGTTQQTVHALPPPPGTHEIQAVVHVTVHRDSESSDDELLHESTRELRATFQVLEDRPPNLIRMQPDPALTKVIRESLEPESAFVVSQRDQSTGRRYVELNVRLNGRESMPADVAFEAFAEFGSQSVPLGDLVIRSGEPHRLHRLVARLTTEVPDEIRVRLVASADTALRTVDLQQIWDGELDLGTIPVRAAQALRKWLKEQQAGE